MPYVLMMSLMRVVLGQFMADVLSIGTLFTISREQSITLKVLL